MKSIERLPTISNSRKKIKLQHPDSRFVTAFDLTSIDAALDIDLKADFENEFYDEEENIRPNDYCTSPSIGRGKNTNDDRSIKENIVMVGENIPVRDCPLIHDGSDDYNQYISQMRKHLHYLNTREDEELIFSVRAKLFEFVTGYDCGFHKLGSHLVPSNKINGSPRWMERGTGEVKFLRNLQEGIRYGTVSLVMYREGTLKLLMDHLLEPGLEACSSKDKKGRRHYMWTCEDIALGSTRRTFALRFSNERDALSWKDHFERSKITTRESRMVLDPACYAPPVCINAVEQSENLDNNENESKFAIILPFTPATKQKRRLSFP